MSVSSTSTRAIRTVVFVRSFSSTLNAVNAIHGKTERPNNLQAIDVEEPIDPTKPLLGNKKIPYVFDPKTGTSKPMLTKQPQEDHMSQARDAIARGADRKVVNARLKALGLPEIK